MNFHELYRKIEAIDKGEPVKEVAPAVVGAGLLGLGAAGAAKHMYDKFKGKKDTQPGVSGQPPDPTQQKSPGSGGMLGRAADAMSPAARAEREKNAGLEEADVDQDLGNDEENERAEIADKLNRAAQILSKTSREMLKLAYNAGQSNQGIDTISDSGYAVIMDMIEQLSQDYDFSDVMGEHSVGEATAYAKRGITASPKRKSKGFDDTADWIDEPFTSRDDRLGSRAELTGSPTRLPSRDKLAPNSQSSGDDLKGNIERRLGKDYRGDARERAGQPRSLFYGDGNRPNLPKESVTESIEECGDMGPMGSMPPAKQMDNVNMNVSMNASGAGGIRDLLNVIKDIQDGPEDTMSSEPVSITSIDDMGALIDDAYANEPDEAYAPIDAVQGSGDDLHGNLSRGDQGDRYDGMAPRGNPMALETRLQNLYREIKLREGSGPKEKAHSKYVDRSSADSKSKVQAAKSKTAADEKAKPGKALLGKIKSK